MEENISRLEYKKDRLESLVNLSNRVREKERRLPMSFKHFLSKAGENPDFYFRDIFQLFHDMVHHFVSSPKDELREVDTMGLVDYDCSSLFVKSCDNPFFADRLFANRLMNMTNSFKKGMVNNHIFLFEGPPGSGKSTFLNNLLFKLEEYTRMPEGAIFRTYWRLDIKKLGGFQRIEKRLHKMVEQASSAEFAKQLEAQVLAQGQAQAETKPQAQSADGKIHHPMTHLEFSCPKHDHPILQVPKPFRKRFLDELIPSTTFKEKLFHKKEYEWVLRDIPCSICKSLYETIYDLLGDPLEVYDMIHARKAHFNRQFGEGITIFNPGDPIYSKPITNQTLQGMINELLKTDDVDFRFSVLAKTNNGVYALMDIKENNIERLRNLHGIISDGVHKVELVEEHIKSLFVGLVNPEDKVHYEKVQSFQDRIITVNVPYILDYKTEVAIYLNKYGRNIEANFLPGVLENVAKIIIASRLEKDSPAIRRWIKSPSRYSKYLDENNLLLKMELYAGKIPSWLTEEDVKGYDLETRKNLIAESESEGNKGFSGRQSLNIFNTFLTKYGQSDKLITMDIVKTFFSQKESHFREIPDGFVESIVDMYDYNVLQEVKEAIYYYNETQISHDIQNYLFAINFDIGNTEKCSYTGDMIEITTDYFRTIEIIFLGAGSTEYSRKTFRNDIHSEYISRTLAQEMRLENKEITATELFKVLFDKYTKNLKENALSPYSKNENFRRAIQDFGTTQFNTYDDRLRRDVSLLIANLKSKFGYTREGARQVSLYVLDKGLASIYN